MKVSLSPFLGRKMEDTRNYSVQGDHPSKLLVLICMKLDKIIDQNSKLFFNLVDA